MMPTSSGILYQLANLYPADTGSSFTVWVSSRGRSGMTLGEGLPKDRQPDG